MPKPMSASDTRDQRGVSLDEIVAGAAVVAGIALGLLVLKYLLQGGNDEE